MSKILNKLLIKMILKELLEEVFELTFIKYECSINKEGNVVRVTAELNGEYGFIQKCDRFHIDNWVNLIINYNFIKTKLRNSLVDNISRIREE